MSKAEAVPTIAEPRDYEPAVDSLRGLAILMVMWFHQSIWLALPPDYLIPGARELFTQGQLGVPIFFVLSGYLLYKTSRRRFQSEPHPVRGFYIRRFFRIMPLWWLSVTLALVCLQMPWSSYWAYMTFFFGFTDQWAEAMPLRHAWSLFVEETFYLFFPLILPWLFSAARVKAALVISAAVAFFWIQYGHWPGVPDQWKYTTPIANFPYFFLGMGLFHARQNPRFQRWIRKLVCFRGLPLLDLALAALIITKLWHLHEKRSLIVAVIVLLGMTPGSGLHRILNFRFFRICGAYCYSLYLFHMFVIEFLFHHWSAVFRLLGIGDSPAEIKMVVSFAGDLALTLVIAHLVFRWIEKPLNDYGRGKATST